MSPVKKNTFFYTVLATSLAVPLIGGAKKDVNEAALKTTPHFWSQPEDIGSRDLFYGPGGPGHQPQGPYTFVKEDLDGSNPKFVVRDRAGVKWKVKLGVEARPETAATRLLWAVGYYANEDYFLPELNVESMPARLHRGQKLVEPDGSMRNVRLKREDEKKAGNWEWRQDPFSGTREWNGLRVMMAVINNWDLKDSNNAVYQDSGSGSIYMISDLGASFGTDEAAWPLRKAKGNLESYSRSKFIRREDANTVDFYLPGRPRFVWLVRPGEYVRRLHLRWIGRNIPRADARWIGDLLSHLSDRQIHDAFRSAGYSAQEIDGFSKIIERRIAMLNEL